VDLGAFSISLTVKDLRASQQARERSDESTTDGTPILVDQHV
jgi:hypothetical protein